MVNMYPELVGNVSFTIVYPTVVQEANGAKKKRTLVFEQRKPGV